MPEPTAELELRLARLERELRAELERQELDVNARIAALGATLRAEHSRDVAAVHDRIDRVHTLALRKLTDLLERRSPQ